MSRLAAAVLFLMCAASLAQGAVVTVNDSGDSTNACATTGTGTCTLRDAMSYANAHSATTIVFNIPVAGVHTISPANPLPPIMAQTTIDGYTQPGASANSNGPTQGTNAVILIELDGAITGTNGALFLNTGSDGTVIRGLAINRASGPCINIVAGGNHVIEGNFLGTDPTGMIAHGCSDGIDEGGAGSNITIGGTAPAARNLISGNGGAGIFWGLNSGGGSGHHFQGNLVGTDATGAAALTGATQEGIILAGATSNTTVGGTTGAERNVVSGNGVNGIRTETAFGTGVVVSGNYVGTDVTGTVAVPNHQAGVTVEGPGVTIGGSAAGAGNLISGNLNYGIGVYNNGAVIQGNLIGADASGTLPLPNGGTAGIWVDGSNTTIGGIQPGEGNVIAYSGTTAALQIFVLASAAGTRVRGNSIHDNPGLALSLDGSGTPLANDPCDVDSGNNNFQNFPVLSSVTYGATTTVAGVLNSTANTTFDIDIYANPPCSRFPRTFLQGATYLGSTQATTDNNCTVSFEVSSLPAVPAGSPISMTATDPAGNTSEYSQRLPFSVAPPSSPSAGGTSITIAGTNFQSGATVTVGGTPAAGVVVNSYTSLSATTPALAPGSANDIVVANTDGSAGTLIKGFVADFLDVPNTNTFYTYVNTLVSNAITAGIGGGLYGVNDNTLRQQMAVFLLKAKHGLCYVPPACTGVFSDVPCPSTFANWIEAMAAEGITGGCGTGIFCPQNPVRRDQMAVFLLKAKHGSSYIPPMCTGIFTDVPCPSTFASWIEQLYHENVTGGCGANIYCPSLPNTRGQMAVFIIKTFNLQ
jgi:hypothetical protein